MAEGHTPNTMRPSATRKAYRACVACVNSKIRCEDVTYPEGCLRCRTKKRVCSLSTVRASNDLGESLPNSSDGLLLCRMRALEDELANMRKLLLHVQTQSSAPTIGSGRSESSLLGTPVESPSPRPISTAQLASALNWRRVQMSEGLFSMSSGDSFPDPIRSQLFTVDELDGAFDLLKARLSTRYPATPFLRSSTPLPRHPFVRLAIAAHTLPSTALYQHIETSLVIVATGTVSANVLLALFIMSLAPFPVDCSKAPVTSLRYISLAYSLGQSMGLDTAAQVNMASPWLIHESWADSLSELLLWEAIRNRYTMLGCMQSRLSATTTAGAAELPRYFPEIYDMAIRSLVAEREMFAIVAPLLYEIGKAETESMVLVPDMSTIMGSWLSVISALESWRSRLESACGLLLLDSYAFSFSLALRLSCIVQNIPSPINPDPRFGYQTFTGVSMMQNALKFCEQLNGIPEYELPTLPAYLLSHYAVAVAIQQRSLEYFQAICVTSEDLNQSLVDQASSKIMNVIGGLPAAMLRDVRSHFKAIPYLPANGNGFLEADFGSLFEGVPSDFWQLLQPPAPDPTPVGLYFNSLA